MVKKKDQKNDRMQEADSQAKEALRESEEQYRRLVEELRGEITAREQAEKALSHERDLLTALMDSTPDLMYFKDNDSRFTKVNEATARLAGMDSPEELVGKTDFDYLPPGLAQRFREDELRIMESGQPLIGNLEYSLLPDGEVRWRISTKLPIKDEEGRVTGIAGVSRDITGLMRAEESLRESEERYRNLFDFSLSGVALHEIVLDAEGHPVDYIFLEVNPAFEELTGLSAGEVIGKRVTELFPGIEDTPVIDIFGRVALTGEPTRFEPYAPPLDRHYAIAAFSPRQGQFAAMFDDITEHKRAEDVARKLNAELEDRVRERTAQLERANEELQGEITQRVKAEEALTEERNLLRTLIDSLPDFIFIKDAEGRHLMSNAADLRSVGAKSQDEMVGKTDFDLFPRELAEEFYADDCLVLQTGEPILDREEPAVDQPTGKSLWLSTTKVPWRNTRGEIIGIMGISRDITERKRAAEELGKLNAELEDRVRERTARVEAASKELQDSEAFLRLVIDTSLATIFVKNRNGEYLLANKAHGELHGIAPEEFVGKTNRDLAEQGINTIEEADKWRIEDSEVIDRQQPKLIPRQPLTRADGTAGWAQTIKVPLTLHDDPNHVLGMSLDITEQVRAEEAVQRRAEELAALQATVLDIAAAKDLPALLQTIVERAARLLGAAGGGLYLCDPDKQQLRCVVSYNTTRDYVGTTLQYGEGAAGVVAQTEEPLVIDDYRSWSQRAAVCEEDQPFSAVLTVPMAWQGQVTGVISVLDDVETRRFTQNDLELLTLFASHAAIAVENARLYEQALTEITERVQAEEVLIHE